jgi:hypothetical protein
MYTAQGEFLCRPNVEHFGPPQYMCGNVRVESKDKCCYGIPVSSQNECNTCGKIKTLFDSRGKQFKAKNIKQCIPVGSWKGTCAYPLFDNDGFTFKAGCFNINGLPAQNTQNTSTNLTLCNSQSYSNIGGQLKCDR